MLHDAQLWLRGKSGLKRKGKQSVKPWHVQIEDLNPENAGTGKVKGKVSYMYKVCITVNFIGSFQGSKPPIGTVEAEHKPGDNSPPTREEDIIQEIESRHFCQKHGKACHVFIGGMHYTYSVKDLSIWAKIVVCIGILATFCCTYSFSDRSRVMQMLTSLPRHLISMPAQSFTA